MTGGTDPEKLVARILILDDDPWILRMVTTVLRRRGHEVETAANGLRGLEAAEEFGPDLIISDVKMPEMNGWTFVRTLRSHQSRDMALVPVIFLTGLNSEEDRILGFRLGADDYLAKPFRFEELDLRVERALENSRLVRSQLSEAAPPRAPGPAGGAPAEPEQAAEAPALSGDLTQVGVHAVLTLLELERKTGILDLERDQVGRIFMGEGRPMGAQLEDPPLRGEEAIMEMLTWPTGVFRFVDQEVPPQDDIGKSVQHLLMACAQKMDESGR